MASSVHADETTRHTRTQRSLRAGRRAVLIRLGNRLRAARQEAGLTQAQAAQHVGVTAQTIRNWETARNEPPHAAIQQLADEYNVSVDALLQDVIDPPVPTRPAQRFRYDRVTVDGSKLAQARSNANLTQVEVSYKTGIHPRAIGRYEKNISNPSVTTLQVLASLYDRPAGSFTPEGQFTLEQGQVFDGATTITVSPTSNRDPVLVAYAMSEPFLTEPAKQRIANFILFTFQQLSKSSPKNTDIELITPEATSDDYEGPAQNLIIWRIKFPQSRPKPYQTAPTRKPRHTQQFTRRKSSPKPHRPTLNAKKNPTIPPRRVFGHSHFPPRRVPVHYGSPGLPCRD